MPSVTDVQQQLSSSNNNGKSSSPTPTQQTTTMDPNNTDPITQAILVLEKKQRNLGKRKEKLESYQQEANKGKELHKDQKEALAKYPEVLGQIECAKELSEQLKKIQLESGKNQKRQLKQAAEEKRLQISQRLREYTRIRYLLDHRPTSLKPDESSLLDELSPLIIPSDNSSNSISRSVDIFLTIYQGGPLSSNLKTLTGKTPQEIREILEHLFENLQLSLSEQEQTKELDQINTNQLLNKEYSSEFDTKNTNITVEQIINDNTYFPIDLTKTQLLQDNQIDQSTNSQEFLQTFTVVNSNINDQPSSTIQNQEEENISTNLPTDEQQHTEEQPHEMGNVHRGGQYHNGGANRNYNRGWSNNYKQQQWRGPRGGRYNNSYGGGGQRSYNENNRGGSGSFSNYRGNRGGYYHGGNRGYNGYQKSPSYQQNNDRQQQQVHSAPPAQEQ